MTLPMAHPLAIKPLSKTFLNEYCRLIKTSCNKIKPNKITSSDRNTSIAKADVQTSAFSRLESQNENACKAK